MARGELGARIDSGDDPDLAGLVAWFNHNTEALECRACSDVRFAADVSHDLLSPLRTMIRLRGTGRDGALWR